MTKKKTIIKAVRFSAKVAYCIVYITLAAFVIYKVVTF